MPEHATRVRADFDVTREELTLVQDGEHGISVVTIPLEAVLDAVPAEYLI